MTYPAEATSRERSPYAPGNPKTMYPLDNDIYLLCLWSIAFQTLLSEQHFVKMGSSPESTPAKRQKSKSLSHQTKACASPSAEPKRDGVQDSVSPGHNQDALLRQEMSWKWRLKKNKNPKKQNKSGCNKRTSKKYYSNLPCYPRWQTAYSWIWWTEGVMRPPVKNV